MFINFWYAAERSADVTDRPVKVRMLGQDFVLFRDRAGAVHCLSNTCVHRGGSLGDGKLQGDHIACPYHGWQFDGGGSCRRIPSLGANAAIPGRTRVDSYPTFERYGLVFVFLGDLPQAERPPILEIDEWEQPGWRVLPYRFEWPVNVTRSVENSLDAPHTEFVHSFGAEQGNSFRMEPEEQRVEERSWGAAHVIRTKNMDIEHGHRGVSHTWTFLQFAIAGKPAAFKFYTYITPVDDSRVRRFIFHARNTQLDERADAYIGVTNAKAEEEDRLVVGALEPRLSPRDTTHEFFIEDDGIMARYRRQLAEWEARGWRIDTAAVARTARKVAYAIPSPARREHKGWVLDPIPLVASGNAPP